MNVATRRAFRFPALVGAFLAGAILLPVFSTPASADPNVYVSNAFPRDGGVLTATRHDIAQHFTTGPAPQEGQDFPGFEAGKGFELGSVEIFMNGRLTIPGDLKVSLRRVNAVKRPGLSIFDFEGPPVNNRYRWGLNRFKAPPGTYLQPETDYFVYMSFVPEFEIPYPSNAGLAPTWLRAPRDSEIPQEDWPPGWIAWTVGDISLLRPRDTHYPWTVFSNPLKMRVLGPNACPAAPAGLSAAPGVGEAALSWVDPGDATIIHYEYRVSNDSGQTWTPDWTDIAGSGATTTGYTVTGLDNGARYRFEVRAVNEEGDGDVSGAVATTLWPAPAGLAAAPGHEKVALEWDKPENGPSRYRIRAQSNGETISTVYVETGSGEKIAGTVSGLANGTEYTFAVQGVTLVAGRFRPASAPAAVSAAPLALPAAPENLEAAPGIDGVALSWDDPQDNTIAGYEYSTDYDDKGTEDDTSDDTGTFTAIARSDATTTSHLVTVLAGGTAYTFALRAVNPSGAGAAASVTATTVPDAPAGLAAAPGIGGVALSWTDPQDGTITRYDVSTDYDPDTGTGTFIPIADSDENTTAYTVTVRSDGNGEFLAGGTAYTFAVRAVNDSGKGAASDPATATTVPDKPTGLEPTAGDAKVLLEWASPDTGAIIAGYEVSTDGGENFAPIAGSDGSTISHLVESLDGGKAYTFAVRAVNDSGAGAASDPATATTVPDKPTGLEPTAGDAKVLLEWASPDTGAIIAGYEVSTDGGATFAAIDNNDLETVEQTVAYTVTGLTNGTGYTFAVRAVNLSGAGAASDRATATPLAVPRAPANLAAAVAIGGVTLSWTDPPADTSVGTIAGYEVSVTTGDGDRTFAAATVERDGTTVSHTVPVRSDESGIGLDNSTAYTFAVRAANASGKGAASSVDATTLPAAPENLKAAVAIGGITLSWDDPDDDTIYRYQFSTDYNTADDTGTFIDIAGSDGDTGEHLVTGLDGGTAYTFAVRAATVSGAVGAASSVTATTLPAAPANLRAAPGIGEVTLSWDDPGDSTIDRYRVSTDGGATFADIGNSDLEMADGTTSYTMGNLSGGTAYTFAVHAATASDAVGATSSATATTLPDAPTGLDAAPGVGEVTLSWDNPNDSTIAKYRVSADYDPDTGAGTFTDIPDSAPGGANATGYTVPGLSGGTAYTFTVRAATVSGAVGAASSVTATTLPDAPAGLEAAPGADGVALSWNHPGDGTIDKYEYRLKKGVEAYSNWTDIGGSNATTTAHTVSGLAGSTAYTFSVRAATASGAVGGASSATATTAPAAPADLSATAEGDTEVLLEWTVSSDSTIAGYDYRVSSDSGQTWNPGWTDIAGSDDTTASYTVTGLDGGTEYRFEVRAANASSAGAAAGVVATTWPAATTGLSADAGNEEVALDWDLPTAGAIIDKYQYRVSNNSGQTWSPDWTDIVPSSAATTTHNVTGLTNGTEYTFEVRAANDSGNGEAASATATPAAVPVRPANLGATARDAEVLLGWDLPTAGAIIDKYQYRVSDNSGQTWSPDWTDIVSSSADTTAHNVTGLTNGTGYTFEVRAVNYTGSGLWSSATATPIAVPAAPQNLRATAIVKSRNVNLSWVDPGDTTILNYQYRVSNDSGKTWNPDWTAIDGSNQTTTTHTVTGLTSGGAAYMFAVRAVNASGAGAAASATATTTLVSPDKLMGLEAKALNEAVELSWDKLGDTSVNTYRINYYEGIYYDGIPTLTASRPPSKIITMGNRDSTNMTLLTNGTEHTFAVSAVNDEGVGDASSVTATPMAAPAAPTGFDAKGLGTVADDAAADPAPSGEGEVTLSWDDPQDNTITGYRYRHKKGTDTYGDWIDILDSAPAGADATGYTVTGLDNGSEYAFELRAVNAYGESEAASDNARPLWPAPANLEATPDDQLVHLAWDPIPGSKNYGIALESSNGSWSQSLQYYDVPESRIFITIGDFLTPQGGLVNGTEYTFEVYSETADPVPIRTSVKASAKATPVQQTLPPGVPTSLAATARADEVDLEWSDPNDATIVRYQVRWKEKDRDDNSYNDWVNIEPADSNSIYSTPPTAYTATGLTAGTAYRFEVRAGRNKDANNDNGLVSGAATLDALTLPDKPTDFTATAGDAEIALSWADPGDDTIDRYQFSTDGGATFAAIDPSNATTTTHTVTGLDNGTLYTFAVRAVNLSGAGAASDTAMATPLAVPRAPANLAAAVAIGGVTLSWTDPPADTSVGTITGYEVSVTTGDSDRSFAAAAVERDGTTVSHTVPVRSDESGTGLDNSTAYTFAVRAVNASGAGAASSVDATTLPAAPEELEAAPGIDGVALSWTDPDDDTIDRYQFSTDYNTADDTGTFTDIAVETTGQTIAFTVTGLDNGTAYTFAVRAVNASGAGAASSATATTLPAAPENLRAAPGIGEVTLSWDDPGDSTIDRYQVSTDGGATFADIGNSDLETADGTTSYTVGNLSGGTAYTFAVRAATASDAVGAASGATATTLPAAPENLKAAVAIGGITLSWDDPNDSTIAKYQVSDDDGSTFTDIDNNDLVTTVDKTVEYLVTDPASATDYTFTVRAATASGAVGGASSVTATTLPAAPANLRAEPGIGEVGLSWDDPGDGAIDKYQFSTDGGVTFADIPESDPPGGTNATGYTVPGLENGTAYTFAVRAVNDSDEAGAASSATATTLPGPPENLAADAAIGGVTLSWDDPQDNTITGYEYSTDYDDKGTEDDTSDDTGTFAPIAESVATTVSYLATGLDGGTAYTFAVRATTASGAVGATSSVPATTLPDAPAGLEAAPGADGVALSWTGPGTGAVVTGYEVSTDGGQTFADIPDSAPGGTNATGYTVTARSDEPEIALAGGTAYTFAVHAVNESGVGAASSVTATTVPDAPQNLAAAPHIGGVGVALTWDGPGAGAVVTGYEVSTDGGQTFADIPDSAPGGTNATGYTVTARSDEPETDLAGGVEYTFAVRAVNDSGAGAASSIDKTTVPAAPANLSAAAGNKEVGLRWDNPNDGTITGYEYRVSDDSGENWSPDWTEITNSDQNTVSHNVTGLTNSIEYTFAVRAKNASGEGAASSIDKTTVPAAPANLSAAAGNKEVGLRWDNPNDGTIKGYQVSRDDGDFAAIPDSAPDGTNATSFTVTGLENDTEYKFEVRAVNLSGAGAASEPAKATPIAVPAAPAGLTATARDAEVGLRWDSPTTGAAVTGYQVSTDGGATFAAIDSDGTTVSHTVTGLINGTEYTLAVRAVNGLGPGLGSSATATPVAIPDAPANLSATAGAAGVTLSWDSPSADPSVGEIAWYQVSTDGGDFVDIDGSNATTTAHTVTGLTYGTEHTFAVRAVNPSGEGAVATATLPAAPTDLAATQGDNGAATLSWNDPGDGAALTGYEVSKDGGETFAVAAVDSDGTTVSHTVTGLTNGTEYTFAVRAVNGSNKGAASEATATPLWPAPAGLAATPRDGEVSLEWDSGDEGIAHYQVRAAYAGSGTTYAEMTVPRGPGPGGQKSKTAAAMFMSNDAVEYVFKVRAVEVSGNAIAAVTGHEASVAAAPAPVPAAPENLSAIPANGQAVLTWDFPSDPTIYAYQVSTDCDTCTPTFTDIPDSNPREVDANANATGYTVTGLTNGTLYTLAVRAVNGSGAGAAASVTVTPDGVLLNAPENLQALPGNRKVELRWQPPDGGASVTHYRIEVRDGDMAPREIVVEPPGTDSAATGSTNDTAYAAYTFAASAQNNADEYLTTTVGDLTNDTLYTFAVSAENDAGEGPEAIDRAAPQPVGPPKNLTADPGDRRVLLEWEPPGGGIEFHGYEVSVRTDDDATFVPIEDSDATTTGYAVEKQSGDDGAELVNGIDYRILVRAVIVTDGSRDEGPPAYVSSTPKATQGPARTVSFGAAAYEAGEGGGDAAVITVKLNSPAADAALAIPVTVAAGTAEAGDYEVTGLEDWDASSGTGEVGFEIDEDTATFTVTPREDGDFDDETVMLGFGTPLPNDVVAGAPAAAVLTIVDAEGAAVRSRFSRLNAAILSKHALGIADGASRAVGRRMADAFGGRAAASFSLAGGSTVPDALRSNAQAIADGALTLEDVLARSSFLLPLSADDGGKGGPGGAVLWGGGERQALEGTDPALAWDGAVTTGRIGIDARLRGDLLAGLALSRSVGAFDYTDGTGPAPARGSYESRMTGVHPYLGWKSPQGLGLWGALGYGRGGIEIDDAQVRASDSGNPVRRSDTVLKTATLSADGPLVSGGATALALRGEASVVRVEVEGDGGLIERQTVDANRLRLALEGSYEWALASGGTLRTSLEMGLRHDGGDGAAGGGIEVGVGLGYRDPAAGLSVEGHGRMLGGQDDYREWGVGGSLRLEPGAGGRGLSFSLAPSWGDTATGVDRLWDRGVAAPATGDDFPQMQMDSEFGYGYGAFGGRGLLTPYGGLSLAGGGGLTYRLGSRIEIGTRFDFDLKGERNEPAGDTAPEHSIVLRIQVRL